MPQHDPVTGVIMSLAIILVAAKLGGHLACRINQPPVLGELLAGVILSNLALLGYSVFSHIAEDPSIDMLSRIGVILLLFSVGLESTVKQMMQVGFSAMLIAALGVFGSLALGLASAVWFLPAQSTTAHVYIGAMITATSVGITARVLKDLGKSRTQEARMILGAAIIDDILGLLILAVMTSLVAGRSAGAISYGGVG